MQLGCEVLEDVNLAELTSADEEWRWGKPSVDEEYYVGEPFILSDFVHEFICTLLFAALKGLAEEGPGLDDFVVLVNHHDVGAVDKAVKGVSKGYVVQVDDVGDIDFGDGPAAKEKVQGVPQSLLLHEEEDLLAEGGKVC